MPSDRRNDDIPEQLWLLLCANGKFMPGYTDAGLIAFATEEGAEIEAALLRERYGIECKPVRAK